MGLNNEPYLSNRDIEDATLGVIAGYENKFHTKVTGPAVPIDQIVSAYLKIEYIPADVVGKTGIPDCMALFFVDMHGEMSVEIDQSLWPDENPQNQGRFNFTLAHEAMHLALHKKVLFDHLDPTPLLIGERRQVVLCRSSKKDRREIQADIGASYLLMPTEFILREWEKKFGASAGPQNVYKEIMLAAERQDKDPKDVRDAISIEFASIFNVSAYAMQIRLRDMKLLELEEPQPTLF